MNMSGISAYQRYGKRLFDLLVAVPFVVLISPLMLLVWLCSRLLLGKPVLFRQQRAGYRGQPFMLRKFRSMADTRDERGVLLPDAQRLTGYGRLLRSTSLDELPSLWNVIRGEMSLIGPRPLPVEYTPLYTEQQARRLDAVPGVAGYAAIFGRNAQSWESIFERDVWYVDHVSFLLDLRIILGVIGVVLGRKGIDRGDHNRDSQFQRRVESATRGRTYVSGT
jgi:sugar transferase EpsL